MVWIILKDEDYDLGILCAIDRFELLYICAVVYRVVTKLSLHDHMITLVAVLLSLPHLAQPNPIMSESEVQD